MTRLTTTAVGATLWCALMLGFYTLVHCPLHAREADQHSRIVEIENLLMGDVNVHAAHIELRQSVEALESQITTVRQRIPADSLEATFLSDATMIAQEEQLSINNFRRERPHEFPDYSEVDVVITGEGSYESICRFMDRVSRLKRLSTVRKMSIAGDDHNANYPFEVVYSLQFGIQAELKTDEQEAML